MKHLSQFLFEMLNESEASDKLLDLLNSKTKLDDFVAELNKALKNASSGDNAELWIGAIKDLFDGENGDQYKSKNHIAAPVSKLFPTQSEIDIENSAKWATKDWGAKGVADMFGGEAFGKSFPVPVLVYEADGKDWIIDGHHRWSQVALINPEATIDCMVVAGPESAQDFLKIVQGIIASVIASDNNNKGKNSDSQLPIGAAKKENNIFGEDLEGDKLTERITEMFKAHEANAKTVIDILQKNGKSDVKDIDSLAKYITANRDLMIEKKQTPPDWAAPRPVMPQSDAAGPNDAKNANDANPDVEGSALYKILKKGKFPQLGN